MILLELSSEYRDHANSIKTRIAELKRIQEYEDVPGELAWRIKMLTAMWREARDIAVLCERYYERGYRRNAKYTV